MLSRSDWVDAALQGFALDGEQAIRIDRLAAHLGVTKGSFHHHFDGVGGLRQAMLATYEERQREVLTGTGELVDGLDTLAAVQVIADTAVEMIDVQLERAIRAWAVRDASAAAVVARIDAGRLALLEDVWGRKLDPDTAHIAALLPHLVLIGAAVSQSTSRDELAGVVEMLGGLAAAVG